MCQKLKLHGGIGRIFTEIVFKIRGPGDEGGPQFGGSKVIFFQLFRPDAATSSQAS
jgi:hypothetical protein